MIVPVGAIPLHGAVTILAPIRFCHDVMCDVMFTVLLHKFYCLNIAGIVKNVFITSDYRL